MINYLAFVIYTVLYLNQCGEEDKLSDINMGYSYTGDLNLTGEITDNIAVTIEDQTKPGNFTLTIREVPEGVNKFYWYIVPIDGYVITENSIEIPRRQGIYEIIVDDNKFLNINLPLYLSEIDAKETNDLINQEAYQLDSPNFQQIGDNRYFINVSFNPIPTSISPNSAKYFFGNNYKIKDLHKYLSNSIIIKYQENIGPFLNFSQVQYDKSFANTDFANFSDFKYFDDRFFNMITTSFIPNVIDIEYNNNQRLFNFTVNLFSGSNDEKSKVRIAFNETDAIFGGILSSLSNLNSISFKNQFIKSGELTYKMYYNNWIDHVREKEFTIKVEEDQIIKIREQFDNLSKRIILSLDSLDRSYSKYIWNLGDTVFIQDSEDPSKIQIEAIKVGKVDVSLFVEPDTSRNNRTFINYLWTRISFSYELDITENKLISIIETYDEINSEYVLSFEYDSIKEKYDDYDWNLGDLTDISDPNDNKPWEVRVYSFDAINVDITLTVSDTKGINEDLEYTYRLKIPESNIKIF